MAHGLKCYCCGVNTTSITHYYCYDCVKKLKNMFDSNNAYFGTECYEIVENRIIQNIVVHAVNMKTGV